MRKGSFHPGPSRRGRMTVEETIDKLTKLKLPHMAQALREQLDRAVGSAISVEDCLGLRRCSMGFHRRSLRLPAGVVRRRSMSIVMAWSTSARLDTTVRSYSLFNRRYLPNQPLVRSTIHRLRRSTNPFWPSFRLTTSTVTPVSSCTLSMTSPRYALSAHTRESVGYCRCPSRRTGTAPSRSCTDAGVTSTTSTSPRMSTRRCRLRPFTFFPRVEAGRAADVGRLDTLAINYSRGRFGTSAFRYSDEPSEVVVYGVECPRSGPPPVVFVDGGPGRKVVREQPPGSSGARTVSDRVHDLPRVVSGLREVGKPNGDRNHVGDDRPFVVGEVGRIAAAGQMLFDCHGLPKTTVRDAGPNFLWNTFS